MAQRIDPGSSTLPKDAKPEDVRKVFDAFSNNYDEDIKPDSSYPAVKVVVKTFVEVIGDVDKNMRIIDLGAGTWYAGVELKKYGFTNTDGLDLSPGMLQKAEEKNAYKNYICEAVTEKRLDIPTGTYDAVISSGAVSSGYIKPSAFDEVIRLVKPGGYIAFTIRGDTYDQDEFGYTTKFKQLVSDGKWEEVKNYSTDYVLGHLSFQKKCYILCYKVLKNE